MLAHIAGPFYQSIPTKSFTLGKRKKYWNKKRSSASSYNPSPKGGVLDEPTVALGDEAFAAA